MRKMALPAVVWKEGNWYVAVCPHPHVASQGRTEKTALKNLKEAVELYFQDETGELKLLPSQKSVCTKISIELPAS